MDTLSISVFEDFGTTFFCVCTVCLCCRQPGVGLLKTTSNQIIPTSLGDSRHMMSKLLLAGLQLQADTMHPTPDPMLPEEVASNHMCMCISDLFFTGCRALGVCELFWGPRLRGFWSSFDKKASLFLLRISCHFEPFSDHSNIQTVVLDLLSQCCSSCMALRQHSMA